MAVNRHTNLIVKFLNCLGDLKEKKLEIIAVAKLYESQGHKQVTSKKINTKQVARTQL